MRASLDRAVRRGDIKAVPDLSLVGDLIEGPPMHRRMIGRAHLTAAAAIGSDGPVAGVGPAPFAPSRSG